MIRYYPDIEPLGGYKDKGRDALHFSRRNHRHTIFQYSVRKDWKVKLNEDLAKIKLHAHPCDEVVFISNQEISAGDRDRVIAMVNADYGWRLRLCPLEKLATMIDDRGSAITLLYPEIFFLPSPGERAFQPLDVPAYLEQVVRDRLVWEERYTALFVDRFEFDLRYTEADSLEPEAPLEATQIPSRAPISVLLGESGAGKTTTLWKLALSSAKSRLAGEDGPLPILASLRSWSERNSIFQLVVDQFASQNGHPAAIEAILLRGDALILLDGVDELPALPAGKEAAGQDLRAFLQRFPKIQVILTCRTSAYFQEYVDPGQGRPPVAYEAQRLTSAQIEDYVRRTLDAEVANRFLQELQVDDAHHWADDAAIVHLARIPFLLRLLLADFSATGQLPESTAELVQRLVQRLSHPRPGQQAPGVDLHRREQILSAVAGASLETGGGVSLSASLAREAVDTVVSHLHATHSLDPMISADALWTDLLSQNLLHQSRVASGGRVTRTHTQVEWLHQLFRDYFLALFLVSLSFDADPKLHLVKRAFRLASSAFITASVMALSLAPSLTRRRVLFDELRVFDDMKRALLRRLPRADIEEMLLNGVEELLTHDIVHPEELVHAALYAHSLQLPELLLKNVKGQHITTKRAIATTLSAYIIDFHGEPGTRRAVQGLNAMIAHQDDQIRYLEAAKMRFEV